MTSSGRFAEAAVLAGILAGIGAAFFAQVPCPGMLLPWPKWKGYECWRWNLQPIPLRENWHHRDTQFLYNTFFTRNLVERT